MLNLGLFLDVEVGPFPKIDEIITVTDTVGYNIVVCLKETVRTYEHFVIRMDVKDSVFIEETFGARAKGPVQTLYISDPRYFKTKNA